MAEEVDTAKTSSVCSEVFCLETRRPKHLASALIHYLDSINICSQNFARTS
jgi:hypothetical protein